MSCTEFKPGAVCACGTTNVAVCISCKRKQTPNWSCEQEPDGECTVVIALGDDVARVSTKGRPSFQTVEDSVYTIVECYRDYFYAVPEGEQP